MTQPPQGPITLPPRMKAALEQYRKRVWAIKLAEGALAAAFGLAVSYLLVFVLDRWGDTPAGWRAAILAAGSVGMVILFPLKYHNWVWRHRRLDQAARLLRHKYPRFGDHLLGIVELAQNPSQAGASRALVEAAMRQVDAELQGRDLRDAVPHPRHRRWAWAAGVPLTFVAAVMVMVPAAGGNALLRWAMPWRDVERYTFAQLEGETGLRVVPYAESFTVRMNLAPDSAWKPEAGTAQYEDQSPVVAAREGATYPFRMPPQTRNGRLSLHVGDARLVLPVEPKTRPALTALRARVQLPAYLQRTEPQVEDVRGGTISLVKGSAAIIEAAATRELASATLNGRSQPVDGSQITTEPVTVEVPAEYHLTWRDRFGLDAREPQVLRIEAVDDGGPTVSFSEVRNNQVLLSTEVLSFEIRAGDDFGVKQVGLEWEGIADPVYNPEPSKGEKIVAAGTPVSSTLSAPATFSADRENVRAQSLRLRAYAEDYLPDRERACSPYLVLHVLTPAEHFKWLTSQMGKWVGSAREVYDRELQLSQVNEELRQLPPEALDAPAQRKLIRDQATAEMANAAQLDALITVGEGLVREATRNEDFDPEQLETWAGMLQQLEEIAGARMPSVAGLLAQAAAAPGQSRPPAETPEDPNTPGAGVGVDRSEQPGGQPAYAPANPTPQVGDQESGFNKSEEPTGEAPQVAGGLRLPTTTLRGSGREPGEPKEPAPTTDELVLKAVTEQQDLLDAFAGVADEMRQLLVGFESSTFVKRLKAASRAQIDLAGELNNLGGFGRESHAVDNAPERRSLGEREVAAAGTIYTIQEDMDAYANRRPSENYARVLDEMQHESVIEQLRGMASTINDNLVGQSTIEAEFWGETLDRWAEQLVDPLAEDDPSEAEEKEEQEPSEQPSLPPAIVVEVLRIINREIQLREETRELEHGREAMAAQGYEERGGGLGRTQRELAVKSRELAGQIWELPGAEEFESDSRKLMEASFVMDEAEALLATPVTGPETIAAISEVIEILLETNRTPNAPSVTKSRAATRSALMLVGLGDDEQQAFIEERVPGQATGRAGRTLPEEFRQGLDAYFDALEGSP